jgi:hypothetical protein
MQRLHSNLLIELVVSNLLAHSNEAEKLAEAETKSVQAEKLAETKSVEAEKLAAGGAQEVPQRGALEIGALIGWLERMAGPAGAEVASAAEVQRCTRHGWCWCFGMAGAWLVLEHGFGWCWCWSMPLAEEWLMLEAWLCWVLDPTRRLLVHQAWWLAAAVQEAVHAPLVGSSNLHPRCRGVEPSAC